MKYKNIKAAIHNFGHSFTSSNNYVDGGHTVDDLDYIRAKGHDIEIDWFKRSIKPRRHATRRIVESIGYWGESLEKHLIQHDVQIGRLESLLLRWPADGAMYMLAKDDRGKQYEVPVKQTQ